MYQRPYVSALRHLIATERTRSVRESEGRLPRRRLEEAGAPQEGSWVARDFRFHTGEVIPELRLHYRTIGAPSGEPLLVLHGTAGSGASILSPGFAGELFDAGLPMGIVARLQPVGGS